MIRFGGILSPSLVIYHFSSLVGSVNCVGMFALGFWMVSLNYYDVWYHKAPEIHKSIVFILFLVMIFRVLWRFISPPLKLLDSYNRLVKISSTLVQVFLICFYSAYYLVVI